MASQSIEAQRSLAPELFNSTSFNEVKEIRRFLDKEKQHLEQCAEMNMTPLMEAAKKGDKTAFEDLIQLGADVNAVTKRGVSVLSMAVYGGNLDIIELLLGFESVMNSAKVGDFPPLCVAAMVGNGEMVTRLLKAGLGGTVGKSGMTPLMFAAIFNHFEIMAILKEYGEDLFKTNLAGQSAFDMLKHSSASVADIKSKTTFKVEPIESKNDKQQPHICKRRNVAVPRIIIQEFCKPIRTAQKHKSVDFLTSKKQFRFSPQLGSHQGKHLRTRSSINQNVKQFLSNVSSPASALSPTVAIFFGKASKRSFSPLPANHYSPLISPIEIVQPPRSASTEYVNSSGYLSHVYVGNMSYGDNIGNKPINKSQFDEGDDSFTELVQVLAQYKLDSFAELFIRQEINYATFMTLTDFDLQRIGIAHEGHRQQLLFVINRCQQNGF